MHVRKWISPVFDFDHFGQGLREYWYYLKSWRKYTRLPDAEDLSLNDAFPCLYDRTVTTGIDGH